MRRIAFLKLGNLVIETYENKAAKMESGAIDHVAIDVKDVEKVHELVTAAGLNTTNDEVHFLPFWEKGVKFILLLMDRIRRRWSSASIYKMCKSVKSPARMWVPGLNGNLQYSKNTLE